MDISGLLPDAEPVTLTRATFEELVQPLVRRTLRACRRHGVETLAHFVIGLPEDRFRQAAGAAAEASDGRFSFVCRWNERVGTIAHTYLLSAGVDGGDMRLPMPAGASMLTV